MTTIGIQGSLSSLDLASAADSLVGWLSVIVVEAMIYPLVAV